MINVIFLEPNEISNEEREDLWNQDVNMDDIDYMLIVDKIDEFEINGKSIILQNWTFNQMLTGVCNNEWYKVNFRGETVIMGVAYQA